MTLGVAAIIILVILLAATFAVLADVSLRLPGGGATWPSPHALDPSH